MRLSQTFGPCFLTLTVALSLVSSPGCGSDLPETGTAASPVNLEKAASQNKAMQDAYKSKMPVSRTRK